MAGLLGAATVGAFDPAAAREPVGNLQRKTWKVGDVTREALVYAPTGGNANRPVVFAFHGHGGRGQIASRKFAFHQHWPEAVCVYPTGLPTAAPVIDPEGKRNGWQKAIGDQQDRDLAFFDAMLKTMKTDYAGDAKRVYAAGHSNGGFFVYTLAAARGDQLAAIASVAGGLSTRDIKIQKPLPVIHVAGKQDRVVRFDLQKRTIEQVRKLNGCGTEGKPAGTWCTEYASRNGFPLVTFIHPGGHEIPDAAPPRITQFFKSHSRK